MILEKMYVSGLSACTINHIDVAKFLLLCGGRICDFSVSAAKSVFVLASLM
jgi:hypothetical protein